MTHRRLRNGVRAYLGADRRVTTVARAGEVVTLDPLGHGYSRAVAGLVPTPLPLDREARPIELVDAPEPPWWRGFWLLYMILRHFSTRRFRKLTGALDDDDDARRARTLFEQLGGMWIKLGQLLSIRTDILSDAMCRELSSLQYQMTGFPTEVAMRVLEEDLGVPLQRVFSRFEVQPFAAASICQVHRAVLRDNQRAVVVKIMRPGVAGSFSRDLALLGVIVSVLRALGMAKALRLREGLKELRTLLQEETDYSYELLNLKRMRKALARHDVIVPKPFAKLCSQRVLVMEEIPGLVMSRYIKYRRDDPDALRRWEVQNGIEPSEIAEALLITTLRQILEDNQFHGDLHPGNIMLLCDNRIALIDFGSVGRLEVQQWQMYRQITASLAREDFNRAADYMLMMAPSVPATGVPEMRRALADVMRRWQSRSGLDTISYQERSMGALSADTAQILQKHKVPPTWSMMRIGRALGTLDASLQTLSPDGNFFRLLRAYFRDRSKRERSLGGRVAAASRAIGEVSTIVSDVKILLAPQLRNQAFRLRGMADTVTLVKLTLLSSLRHVAFFVLAVPGIGWLADTHAEIFPPWIDRHVSGPLHYIDDALPNLHTLHWVGVVALMFVGIHLLDRAYRAMSRGG